MLDDTGRIYYRRLVRAKTQEPRRNNHEANAQEPANERCREDRDAISEGATVDNSSTNLDIRGMFAAAGRALLHATRKGQYARAKAQ